MTLSTNNTAPRRAVFPVVTTSAQSQALQKAKSSGFTQGHAAGYAAGLQLAGREAAAQRSQQDADHAALLIIWEAQQAAGLQALRLASTALTNRTTPVVADAQMVLFGYALELAEALLGQELRDGETSARAALTRACAQVQNEVPVNIRMNPADVAALAALGLPDGVAVQEDTSISRGDAIAQYPHGFLDARLGTAVDRARSALLGDFLPASALLPDVDSFGTSSFDDSASNSLPAHFLSANFAAGKS